jgi:hypothetical protein
VLFGKRLENTAYEYVTVHSCIAMLPSPHNYRHCALCTVTDADADADAAMESSKVQVVTTSKEKELR